MGLRLEPHRQLSEFVDRLGAEHPPIDIAAVDFTVKDPLAVKERFGHVVDYMRRVELEVERNLRELQVLLPDAPEVDRIFTEQVWGPQELRHGAILDRWCDEIGWAPQPAATEGISATMRILGALAHVPGVQDMVRMMVYLTGMATERCAIWAYGRLGEHLAAMGEVAAVDTLVVPIRRQEPGHFAYYRLAAQNLAGTLAPWQKRAVRHLRARTFAPVGVGNPRQSAQFGHVILDLAGESEIPEMAAAIGRLEGDLLGASDAGVTVPDHVLRAFREAVQRAEQTPASTSATSSDAGQVLRPGAT